jgi:D-aspartate ligase
MKKSENITPYLLGGDLNAYSVARAFFEAEGVRSRAFMRYKTGITSHVGFLSVTVNGELCRPEVLKGALLDCAKSSVGERPLLIPCADWYTEALQQLRRELSERFRLFLPPKAVWQIL